MVWFLSNEVGTDLGYMKQMSAFVRSLDPSRLVSLVDNTKWNAENLPWAKFREAKIDFIAQNAYGSGSLMVRMTRLPHYFLTTCPT